MVLSTKQPIGRLSRLIERTIQPSKRLLSSSQSGNDNSSSRTFFGIAKEKIRQSDARRAAAKQVRSEALREELRSLPIRQMQVLLSDKKPESVATPIRLTPAKDSPVALPASKDWPCVDANENPFDLGQILTGKNKLTLLHISFSAHSFELGQDWINAAQESWKQIQSEDPAFSNQTFQCYSLSLIKQSWLRNWFGQSTIKALKSTINNPDREPFTLSCLSTPHVQSLQASPVLSLTSQELLGYVMLIDGAGRLRWRAWGQMDQDEAKITQVMIKRLAAEQGNIQIKQENVRDLISSAQPESASTPQATSHPQPAEAATQ